MNATSRVAVELLEGRQLLSATVEAIAGSQFTAAPGTASSEPRFQMGADAAGNLVYAWRSDVGADVLAQRFTPTGVPVGGPIAVNQTSDAAAPAALAVAANGSFAVAWDATVNGVPQVRARLYRPDGTPVGNEVTAYAPKKVNRYTSVGFSNVAIDDDGDVVVSYRERSTSNDAAVRVQRIGKAGAKVGSPVQVNVTAGVTAGSGANAVAMDAAGNFVVAWTAPDPDGNDSGIRAARFAADGTRRGTEFGVNAATGGAQIMPDVDMAADGRFVVVWDSRGGVGAPAGTQPSIFIKGYARDGTVTVPDRRISGGTYAVSPSVDVAADGRYVVAYEQYTEGPVGVEDLDVYANAYEPDGALIGSVVANAPPYAHMPEIATQANGEFAVGWCETRYNDEVDDPVRVTRFRIVDAPAPTGTAFATAAIDEDDLLA